MLLYYEINKKYFYQCHFKKQSYNLKEMHELQIQRLLFVFHFLFFHALTIN